MTAAFTALVASTALVAPAALAACGGASRPPLANRDGASPGVLAFASWDTVWQLRRDGERARLTRRTPGEVAAYDGTQSGRKLELHDTCGGEAVELECAWEDLDIYPAGARMREGCQKAQERWTAPATAMKAFVCEVAKGPFPGAVRDLIFVPGLAIETTSSACSRGDVTTILVEYRAMQPEQARAALAPSAPSACRRRSAR